jgi:hypothetical protein
MDETLMTEWLPGSLHRIPSWRWARATWLHDQKQPAVRPLNDAWVRRALSFLVAKDIGRKSSASRHRKFDAAIVDAMSVSQESPSARRLELEARLLTDEPIEAIAQKCSLTTGAVEAYEMLHFNVRPYLDRRDWVAATVIGAGLWNGFKRDEDGPLLKSIAWQGGPLVLDVALAVLRNHPLPDCVLASFGDKPIYEEHRLRLIVKLTIAALRKQSAEQLVALTAIYEKAAALDRESVGTTRCLEGGLQVARCMLGLAAQSRKPSLRERVLSHMAQNTTAGKGRRKRRRAPSSARR